MLRDREYYIHISRLLLVYVTLVMNISGINWNKSFASVPVFSYCYMLLNVVCMCVYMHACVFVCVFLLDTNRNSNE